MPFPNRFNRNSPDCSRFSATLEVQLSQFWRKVVEVEQDKITYDGSVQHEPSGVLAMGGQADAVVAHIREHHRSDEG